MDIFIINLPTEPERWRAVAEQFHAAGLQALRHEATDGAALSPDERAALYRPELNRRQYHRSLCAGEIGCYASHLAVWRRLLDSGQACAAVFEDDIEIAPELPRTLAAIEHLPRGWDMVKLAGRTVEKVDTTRALFGEHRLIQYRRVPCLTSGYVVSRSGAEKLMRRARGFGRPVDVDLRYWWECGLALFGVQPYPVRESMSAHRSTIGERRVRPTLAGRLHRLALQAEYTWLNRQACRARGDLSALPQARGKPAWTGPRRP